MHLKTKAIGRNWNFLLQKRMRSIRNPHHCQKHTQDHRGRRSRLYLAGFEFSETRFLILWRKTTKLGENTVNLELCQGLHYSALGDIV